MTSKHVMGHPLGAWKGTIGLDLASGNVWRIGTSYDAKPQAGGMGHEVMLKGGLKF